ncbi:PrsW family glutamic-type intramembrane protease, partial [Streptosporangium algeriense]
MTDDPSITSGSIRDDHVSRGQAVLIVRLLVGAFLVYLLLDLVRPRRQPDEPTLAVLRQLKLSDSLGQTLAIPPRLLIAVAVGIVTGLVLQALATNARFAEGRRAVALTWATMAAMLGPFALVSLVMLAVFGSDPLVVVGCAASSGFVLWLLHHCQGFARLPARMPLAAFGWGALIVFGLSRVYNAMALGVIDGYLGTGTRSLPGGVVVLRGVGLQQTDMLMVHMGVVVGVVTAAGVLLLLIVFRHRVTDAVSGLVLGAAIGLGYNFTESLPVIRLYGLLSWATGATGGFQYWIRQSIGLLGGHVTLCALLGAAVGLAVQTRGRGRRVLIVGA